MTWSLKVQRLAISRRPVVHNFGPLDASVFSSAQFWRGGKERPHQLSSNTCTPWQFAAETDQWLDLQQSPEVKKHRREGETGGGRGAEAKEGGGGALRRNLL